MCIRGALRSFTFVLKIYIFKVTFLLVRKSIPQYGLLVFVLPCLIEAVKFVVHTQYTQSLHSLYQHWQNTVGLPQIPYWCFFFFLNRSNTEPLILRNLGCLGNKAFHDFGSTFKSKISKKIQKTERLKYFPKKNFYNQKIETHIIL